MSNNKIMSWLNKGFLDEQREMCVLCVFSWQIVVGLCVGTYGSPLIVKAHESYVVRTLWITKNGKRKSVGNIIIFIVLTHYLLWFFLFMLTKKKNFTCHMSLFLCDLKQHSLALICLFFRGTLSIANSRSWGIIIWMHPDIAQVGLAWCPLQMSRHGALWATNTIAFRKRSRTSTKAAATRIKLKESTEILTPSFTNKIYVAWLKI